MVNTEWGLPRSTCAEYASVSETLVHLSSPCFYSHFQLLSALGYVVSLLSMLPHLNFDKKGLVRPIGVIIATEIGCHDMMTHPQ